MHDSNLRDLTHNVTLILEAIRCNDIGARDRLIELVYGELHGLARQRLARERPGVTLQPTALVNEAWLRLFGASEGVSQMPGAASTFENRRHFFGAAAVAMHRICVDYARRRRAVKRGGARSSQYSPDEKAGMEPAVFDRDPVQVIAIDEALAHLDRQDPELVEIVRLRYFVDLNLDDTAKVLGISRRTVANRWRQARAWLHRALAGDG